jgi:hypothetical protein
MGERLSNEKGFASLSRDLPGLGALASRGYCRVAVTGKSQAFVPQLGLPSEEQALSRVPQAVHPSKWTLPVALVQFAFGVS